MLSKLWMSFRIASQNIRSNFLHTVLSTLGIVIGVGALVAILSLIDGLEKYARDEITRTTSLKTVMVHTQTQKVVDGVRITNKNHPAIFPADLDGLRKHLDKNALLQLRITGSEMIQLDHSEMKAAAYFTALMPDSIPVSEDEIWKGNLVFGDKELNGGFSAIISYPLASKLLPEKTSQLVGRSIKMNGVNYQITGIIQEEERKENWLLIPLSSFPTEVLKTKAPQLIVQSPEIEKIEPYRKKIEHWLSENFENADSNFHVYTNKMRVEQLNRALLLFKIIMGMITGISVIVGGIGIMNVLLISVTERTVEIGIRKATGAKRGDIILQFLSESVTVSVFGSILGVFLGGAMALVSVPVVKYIIDVPFQTNFTFETLALISVLAILTGIIFGTYPAMRASKLTPIEAIRRE